jgi:hypothetical protein
MEIQTTLLPGQKGTKELQRQYGDKLVCVRYRYDSKRRKRMKTIELIVEEKDLILIDSPALSELVLVDVGYQETELRAQVKAAGGFWEPAAKAWKLTINSKNSYFGQVNKAQCI